MSGASGVGKPRGRSPFKEFKLGSQKQFQRPISGGLPLGRVRKSARKRRPSARWTTREGHRSETNPQNS